MENCVKCGREYKDQFLFCPYCGTKKPEKPTVNKCTECGFEFPLEYKFCPQCGASLSGGEGKNKEKQEPQVKTCPVCGAELSEEMRFCASCGTPVFLANILPKQENGKAEKAEEGTKKASESSSSDKITECQDGKAFGVKYEYLSFGHEDYRNWVSGAGGATSGVEVKLYNDSQKVIKYITMYFLGVNAVGDPLTSFFDKGEKEFRMVGPVEPGKFAVYRKPDLWNDHDAANASLSKVIVEYMDETVEMIAGAKFCEIDPALKKKNEQHPTGITGKDEKAGVATDSKSYQNDNYVAPVEYGDITLGHMGLHQSSSGGVRYDSKGRATGYDSAKIDRVWLPGADSAGGIGVDVKVYNVSEKTIKYVRLFFIPINAVNEAVASTIDNQVIKSCLLTGPIKPEKAVEGRFEHLWYNNSIVNLGIQKVEVQYMDDTVETIPGDRFISRYAENSVYSKKHPNKAKIGKFFNTLGQIGFSARSELK